jgi:hypothetical protein
MVGKPLAVAKCAGPESLVTLRPPPHKGPAARPGSNDLHLRGWSFTYACDACRLRQEFAGSAREAFRRSASLLDYIADIGIDQDEPITGAIEIRWWHIRNSGYALK